MAASTPKSEGSAEAGATPQTAPQTSTPGRAPAAASAVLTTDRAAQGTLRRKTLATLRWFALAGQAAAVVVAETQLGIDLPIAACAGVIAIGVFYNVAALLGADGGQRLAERDARLTLLFDLLQLSALLFLTGGLGNPFAVYLIAPVTIAASTLTLRSTFLICVATIAAATAMAWTAPPLEFFDGSSIEPPPLFLIGFWAAISIGVAFQAFYARRVASESINMSTALGATQAALEREQRVSSIGALAAAAAHELGTPLATITLVASELKRDLGDRPDLEEDISLIADQARRCRDILRRLSSVTAPEDEQIRSAPIAAVIDEAAAPHRDRRARIIVRLDGRVVTADDPGGDQPYIGRSPEVIHGLRNLIQNAVDFAGSTVWIDVRLTPETITVAIGDDGAGFSDDILAELGEPYATTRRGAPGAEGYSGMGLGVFIAKTLLERTGARIGFENAPRERTWPGDLASDRAAEARASGPKERARPSGAIVRVAWPRERIEARPYGRRPKAADAAAPNGAAQDASEGAERPV